VLKVKALYKELDLEGVYKQTEEKSYVEVIPPSLWIESMSLAGRLLTTVAILQLKGQIEAISHAPLKHALHLLLAKIYKRSA
jgi:hypothetical protein